MALSDDVFGEMEVCQRPRGKFCGTRVIRKESVAAAAPSCRRITRCADVVGTTFMGAMPKSPGVKLCAPVSVKPVAPPVRAGAGDEVSKTIVAGSTIWTA